MCGKKHAIQIMIWFCQLKLFLMKKIQQSKKEQNKRILIENFATAVFINFLWLPLQLLL